MRAGFNCNISRRLMDFEVQAFREARTQSGKPRLHTQAANGPPPIVPASTSVPRTAVAVESPSTSAPLPALPPPLGIPVAGSVAYKPGPHPRGIRRSS